MSDLLTHVLAAYVCASVASWYLDGLADRHVPIAMVGATIPDAAKVWFLLGELRTTVFGVELAWPALQTVGAALAFVGIASLFVARPERRVAAAVLAAGAALHVGMDYLIIEGGGLASPYLYPVTWWQAPSPGLYLSSDIWPSVVAATLALAVFLWPTRRALLARARGSRPN